jgi:hypothetical protein
MIDDEDGADCGGLASNRTISATHDGVNVESQTAALASYAAA